MRSSFPWPVIFMWSSQCPCDDASEPHGAKARAELAAGIREGEQVLAVLEQAEGLVAEGRHGREPAAEARREEDAEALVDKPALERERHHDTDQEAPEDVHGERARGKAVVP